MSKLTREEVIARVEAGDDLQWHDLSQLGLSNTNLANAKMKGSNLSRTNLNHANLTEAGLSTGLQEAMNTSSHKRAVAGRKTGQ